MDPYMYLIKNLMIKLDLIDHGTEYTASSDGFYTITYSLKLHNNQYTKPERFQQTRFLAKDETIKVNRDILHVHKIDT